MPDSNPPISYTPLKRPSDWGPLLLSVLLHAGVAAFCLIHLWGFSHSPDRIAKDLIPEAVPIELVTALPSEIEKAPVPAPIPAPVIQTKPLDKKIEQKHEKTPKEPPKTASAPLLSPQQNGQYGIETYALTVAQHVMKFRTYPATARQESIEGRVVLSVLIAPDGDLLDSKVIESSGSHILDFAGLTAVRKATPYPAPKQNMPVSLNIPMNFRLTAD